MRKTLAILVLPVVALFALAGCTPGDHLRIDDPTPGSITDPDFVDLYRFTASANDRLRVRVLRTSGPRIHGCSSATRRARRCARARARAH